MAYENYGKGIVVSSGFDIGAKKPLDSRVTVNTIEERDLHVTENRVYEGMIIFVNSDKKTYQYVNGVWEEFGFNDERLQTELAPIKKDVSNIKSDILGVNEALVSKADIHSHPYKPATYVPSWSDVTGKPASFVPSAHTHTKAQITDFTHTHTKEQITDFSHTHDEYASIGNEHVHLNKSIIDGITELKVAEWNGKSEFDGDYRSLSNKPLIPIKVSQLTNDTKFITISDVDTSQNHSHSNKATIDTIDSTKIAAWDNKSNFDGNYNNLTNKPSIPIVTNNLTNDLKTNYDAAYSHSTSTHAPSNAQKNSNITKSEIEAKLTGTITTHIHDYEPVISKKTGFNLALGTTSGTLSEGNHGHVISQISDLPAIPSVINNLTSTSTTSALSANMGKELKKICDSTSTYVDDELFQMSNDIATMDKRYQLVSTSIVGTTLTLTTDKQQIATIVNGTIIKLPTVYSFHEIHLYFTTTSTLTLTFPSVKWQNAPNILANKTYEIIFTYINSTIGWLGGVVQYG